MKIEQKAMIAAMLETMDKYISDQKECLNGLEKMIKMVKNNCFTSDEKQAFDIVKDENDDLWKKIDDLVETSKKKDIKSKLEKLVNDVLGELKNEKKN